MSITEGTQPAAKQWTGAWTTAQTTASFTPESGALLVALVAADGNGGGAATTASVTDSLSGTWTLLRRENANTGTLGGTAEVWCRDSPGTSMTVSVTGSANSATGGQLVVRTLIGAQAAASQTGAGGIAAPAPGAMQVSVAAGTGGRIYGAAFNFDTSTAMTALANTTVISAFSDTTNGDAWEAFKSSADTAGTATYGFSTSVHGMIAAAEIVAAAGGGTTPSGVLNQAPPSAPAAVRLIPSQVITGPPQVTVPAGLATGTGAALQPAVQTSGSTTASAGLAAGAGTALQPAIEIAPAAALAAGTGTARQPVPAVTAIPQLAAATGTAGQPAIATTGPGLPVTQAPYAVQLVPPRVAPRVITVTGVPVTANAGLATGTGAALQPSVSTSGTTNAQAGLATGAGAALAPVTAITVPASLAAGTSAAPAPVPAVTANAGLATGTGAALQPSVSTSGSTTANAQLATATGTAQPPIPVVVALAGLAAGTGAAQAGQRIIPAGLATGAGTAQVPGIAVLAQAQAATALAAALDGTVPAQHVPAASTATVTDPRDGTASVTAAATSASGVT